MTRKQQPGRDRIDLKLPPEKRELWETVAEAESLTLSEWIRRVCDAAVKRLERKR